VETWAEAGTFRPDPAITRPNHGTLSCACVLRALHCALCLAGSLLLVACASGRCPQITTDDLPATIQRAGELIGYRSDRPASGVLWERRAPTEHECAIALGRCQRLADVDERAHCERTRGTEREYFIRAFGHNAICYAVTKRDESSIVMVMPVDAAPRVKRTEALRVANFLRGASMPSADVYALAADPDNWRQCPATLKGGG
jgi:hypothetical protein